NRKYRCTDRLHGGRPGRCAAPDRGERHCGLRVSTTHWPSAPCTSGKFTLVPVLIALRSIALSTVKAMVIAGPPRDLIARWLSVILRLAASTPSTVPLAFVAPACPSCTRWQSPLPRKGTGAGLACAPPLMRENVRVGCLGSGVICITLVLGDLVQEGRMPVISSVLS